MNNQPIWWEKTVEYRFVLQAERERGLQFAAPLSGLQERAGDAVFSSDSKIVLIEFKRSDDELDSEFEKFLDYQKAVDALSVHDQHHYLVSGSSSTVEPPGSPELKLHACRYFSRTPAPSAIEVLSYGLAEPEFKLYLEQFLSFKKADGRSAGKVGPESVAAAFGVSSKTSKCSSVCLTEYCRIALPRLYEAFAPTIKPHHPSPRGG